MQPVLEGVKVLDFGRYVAGPYCAMLLGELGADVIRIEKRRGGEDRFLCPLNAESEEDEDAVGAIYLQLNRNKRCLTLNPMKPAARPVLEKLIATADVVVANLPDTVLEKMGIDYPSLCRIKPDIILTKVSAYGSQGPYRDKVGFDGTGQAMSGAMHLSGYGNEPMRTYVAWVDNSTAISAAFGTVSALLAREKTGKGQVVECSLLHTALAMNADALIEQATIQLDRKAVGNRSAKGSPSDAVCCSDGKWVMIQIQGPAMFQRWATLVGKPWLVDDPRFRNDMTRADHGAELSEHLKEWCAGKTSAEIMALLEENGMPCAPIYSPQEALDDPQVQQGGFFFEGYCDAIGQNLPLVRAPVRFSDMDTDIRSMAPALGEHTDSILTELGFGDAERQALREERIV